MVAVVVQWLSCVPLFATPQTAAHQASLSFTISWSLLKLMSIESVMLPNDLVLSCPLLLPPSIFPSIRVFSNELALHVRWPKYWSFSISPSNEYSGLISFSDSPVETSHPDIACHTGNPPWMISNHFLLSALIPKRMSLALKEPS